MSKTWPETIEEAVNKSLALLSEKNKKKIKKMPEGELTMLHCSLGTVIRNTFGLWQGNKELLEAYGCSHPDDASTIVIKAIWEEIRKKS